MKADEVYAQVTERVLAALDRGVVPWQRPWTPGARPRSMSTRRTYRGINVVLLALTAEERGYRSPWWGTVHQINELGGHVKKGQNRDNGKGSTTITLWKEFTPKNAEPVLNTDTGEMERPRRSLLTDFRVFNAEQTEGLPEQFYAPPLQDEPLPLPQAVLDGYVNRPGGPTLLHDVLGRAFYQPKADVIHMPPLGEHRSPQHYYAVSYHEASHSTGHSARLARPGIVELDQGGHGFGSHPYGSEELVAEMAAGMLCAETGVEAEAIFENTAAYIGSWLATIKGDPKMVVAAASAAQRAADLVMGRQGELESVSAPGPEVVESHLSE